MGESVKHLELVSLIVSHIKQTYAALDALATIHDLPARIGCEKPPRIGRFRPDVYAIDAPLTRTIIGEAKTHADLEKKHTDAQLRAFMGFLRLQSRPVLVMAVPWQARGLAQTLLISVQRELHAPNVELVILDDLPNLK